MDIGLEIKLLRERKGMSGKELAEKLGLSQSQVSRLEKGQRRINAETLHRIAEILEVSPAAFFQEEEPYQDVNLGYLWRDLGKVIRQERHRRHLSPEELAQRMGKTKGFVQALEEGRYGLDADLTARLTKALKLDPFFLLRSHQEIIGRLTDRVRRLEQAHAEVTLGTAAAPASGTAIPVMGGLSGEYPAQFDARGLPVDTVNEYVYLSGLDAEKCFALYARGDSMEGEGRASFGDGEILVFTQAETIRNRDFAFVRAENARPTFRQVFFERDGRVRLQPLNLSYGAFTCRREEIIRMWPLAAHVRTF
jgi:transcriptional regulator with XRE-family HTH domain